MPLQLPCTHTFHCACLLRVLTHHIKAGEEMSAPCPCCRQPFNIDELEEAHRRASAEAGLRSRFKDHALSRNYYDARLLLLETHRVGRRHSRGERGLGPPPPPPESRQRLGPFFIFLLVIFGVPAGAAFTILRSELFDAPPPPMPPPMLPPMLTTLSSDGRSTHREAPDDALPRLQDCERLDANVAAGVTSPLSAELVGWVLGGAFGGWMGELVGGRVGGMLDEAIDEAARAAAAPEATPTARE